MNKKQKILVCNWKSKPSSVSDAENLVKNIVQNVPKDLLFVFSPSFVHINAVKNILGNRTDEIYIGAQDGIVDEKTVITGEITMAMLKDFGVRYVILGHSERRYVLGEQDAVINEKMRSAINSDIIPILCVGEKEKMSVKNAINFCIDQLSLDIEGVVSEKFIVAYEPVWAIGGDKTIEPEHVIEVVHGIKKYLETRESGNNSVVLYGGSVNCGNISSLVKYDDIDGFLVGSASLNADEVICIMRSI